MRLVRGTATISVVVVSATPYISVLGASTRTSVEMTRIAVDMANVLMWKPLHFLGNSASARQAGLALCAQSVSLKSLISFQLWAMLNTSFNNIQTIDYC